MLTRNVLESRFFSIGSVTAGSLAYSLGQWLILVMLTRQATATDVGLFSLALAVSAPVSLLAGLSLRTVYLTDTQAQREFGDFLFIRILGSTLTVVVSLSYAAMTGTYGAVFTAVVLCKAIDLVTDMFCAPLQEEGRLWRIGLQTGINGVVSPAAVAICLFLFNTTTEIAVLATTLGSTLALVSVLIRNPGLPASTDLTRIRPIVSVALPMGLSAMVVSLLPNIPRYVLNSYIDLEAVGVFSAVAYLTIIGTAVVSAMAQLLLPRLVTTHKDHGPDALRARVLALAAGATVVGGLATGGSILAASPLLTLIYGESYDDPLSFMLLVGAWALGTIGWMFDLGLSTRRLFRQQLLSSLIAAAVVLAASFALIPGRGTEGAAYATVLASASQLAARIGFFLLTPSRPPSHLPNQD